MKQLTLECEDFELKPEHRRGMPAVAGLELLWVAPLTLIALTSCGGSWSNQDLEYAYVLPTPALFQLSLPGTATASSANSALHIQQATTEFNTVFSALTNTMATIRSAPPSSKNSRTRTWGPFVDSANAGFEFEVVVSKTDTSIFHWKVQARKSSETFFEVVSGTVNAAEGNRAGTLSIDFTALPSALTFPKILSALKSVSCSYRIDGSETSVDADFRYRPSSESTFMSQHFVFMASASGTSFSFLAAQSGTLSSNSCRWLPAGAGKCTASLTQGPHAGLHTSECWDGALNRVFYAEDWPGGTLLGSGSECAVGN